MFLGGEWVGEEPGQKAPGRALNRCRWVSRSRRAPVPVCGSTKVQRFPQISSVLEWNVVFSYCGSWFRTRLPPGYFSLTFVPCVSDPIWSSVHHPSTTLPQSSGPNEAHRPRTKWPRDHIVCRLRSTTLRKHGGLNLTSCQIEKCPGNATGTCNEDPQTFCRRSLDDFPKE